MISIKLSSLLLIVISSFGSAEIISVNLAIGIQTDPSLALLILLFEKLEEGDVARIQNPNIKNLHKFAVDYSDAVVQASADIDKDVLSHIKSLDKPFMKYPGGDNYIDAYQDFYSEFISEEEQLEEERLGEVALTQN